MSAIPSPKVQQIPSGENLFKALLLIALLFALFRLADIGAGWLESNVAGSAWAPVLQWLWIGLLAILDVILVIGMGVLAHDAVHRVLFRSPFWNELWGGVLSALALIPFYINRQIHLTHHSYAHQPGLDPENALHHRRFWSACTIGSVTGLLIHYRIFLQNLSRLADRRYSGRLIKDALFMGFAACVYLVLVPGLGIPLVRTVGPMLLVFPLVFAWRALSDHYGIPAIGRATFRGPVLEVDAEAWHRDQARRQREVTGWVVLTQPWLEWLWSHVNYHEVHHKYPWLSHRYLPQVFAATRDSQPYLVVNGYWRSFLNLRHRKYYDSRDATRPYLTTADW
jgi:fatty acid desaturase